MPDYLESTDAAASTSTIYSIGVGEVFQGILSTTSDRDYVAVTLVAGQTYTFGLIGEGISTSHVHDTYLNLRNSSSSIVATDDDGGPGFNSSITYTATTTGTYYLDIGSFGDPYSGDYLISAIEGTRAHFDTDMGAAALLRPDASWSTPGTGATITWAVRDSFAASVDASGSAATFYQLSSAQITAVQAALGMYSEVADLTFVQVNPGSTSNVATMLFSAYTANDGAGAYAYYPGSTSSTANAGDVRLNNNSVSTTSLPEGSYSFFALIHELGHATGLAHPGDYNAGVGVSITYENSAQFIQDSQQYTVMSYFDESNTTTAGTGYSGYADTLMLYDIYALHMLYGANTSTRSGTSVYGFNSNLGGIYDFTVNTIPALCIWDGGGFDRLDLSGYAGSQTISLIQGTFSSVLGYSDKVSIAFGADIENATGGTGVDDITGNDLNNVLIGLGGDDTLNGNGGVDTLVGGGGMDTMNGGDATDVMLGGNHNDTLNGDGGNDKMYGQAGKDTMNGGTGNDKMYGGDQNDTMRGDAGVDKMFGEAGIDVMYGGDDTDIMKGGDDGDWMWGDGGRDFMRGENGDDHLRGGDDGDWLFGDAGNDELRGEGGNDYLNGGADSDTFIFEVGLGRDKVADFTDDVDTLQFDDAIWGGGLSVSDLIATYATITGGGSNILFDFGGGDAVLLLGAGSLGTAALLDDITIV